MMIDANVPELTNSALKDAMNKLGCPNAVMVNIVPRPFTQVNECHANVAKQVAMYGGQQIQGYYIAVSASTADWVAIKHSVWKRDNEYIDITPVDDKRTCNVFIFGVDKLHKSIYNNNNKLEYEV